MAGHNPTINDVAEKAGVSKATVSAVINDSNTVKDSTRQKVLAVVEELNYRPRAAARRGFRPGKAKSLGLVVKETDNPYYAEIIAGVRSFANDYGYTVLIGSSEGDYKAEQRIVEVFKSKDVEGLIIVPVVDGEADLSYLFELKRRNFPFVLLEEIRGIQANLVDVDNVAASKAAVSFLIAQGHTQIIHFGGPPYSEHSEERIDGVRRAYSESKLVFSDDVVVSAGAHLQDGYEQGLAYFRDLKASDRPTAVTCYNDLVALGLVRALTELGLRVPEDVSVIGYDDIDILDYIVPPLTSVHVPKYQMGQEAAEVLIRHIEADAKLGPEKRYLDAKLVTRASTRALHAAPVEEHSDAAVS